MNFKNLSEENKFAFLVNYKIMLANRNIILFIIHEEIKNRGKIKKPKSTLPEIKPTMIDPEYKKKLVEAIIESNILEENVEK